MYANSIGERLVVTGGKIPAAERALLARLDACMALLASLK